MARQLKTYQTTSGFFELAVAAPSMKAALELWGSTSNLFQQGFAKETNDPAVVTATMAHPGVVLRRPVGSGGTFKEQSELPSLAALAKADKHRPRPNQTKEPARKAADSKDTRKVAELYDLEQKRREREQRRVEAERRKAQERRDKEIAKAQALFEAARTRHEEKMADLTAEREALERKIDSETKRWEEEKVKLRADLEEARKG